MPNYYNHFNIMYLIAESSGHVNNVLTIFTNTYVIHVTTHEVLYVIHRVPKNVHLLFKKITLPKKTLPKNN